MPTPSSAAGERARRSLGRHALALHRRRGYQIPPVGGQVHVDMWVQRGLLSLFKQPVLHSCFVL